MSKDKIPLPGLSVRYTKQCDAYYLKQWLSEPGILRWFPIFDQHELEDSVKRWIDFAKFYCSLTATLNGNPCGLVTLYLQPYRKLAHQCEFGVIVGKNYRGSGIGRFLIEQLMILAKNRFKIELLHLQVYEGNPAIALYHKMLFTEFGRQRQWIKEKDGSYSARIFMEYPLQSVPIIDPLPFDIEEKKETLASSVVSVKSEAFNKLKERIKR